ncbi:TonB-dependent siderophore receptor [Pseudomonas sp. S31]|uniref:TonB-dependent siderophore receptor n=1 Tax=Pseudomonas sp. S31 TaxID=1564473 RepID=UPI001F27170E|nr:TonB-dependent receptor [Pseudomonas sp. S31]MBK5003201.1 TonB-dependent siderophore receptor [Pseudomonas sp. S31]
MSSAFSPRPVPRTRLAVALRGVLLASAACMALPVCAASAEQSEVRRYDLPAGTLEQSLNAFAQAAAINLPFDPALVRGKHAAALNGTYSVQQGLDLLLQGSGLGAVQAANGNWLLDPMASTGGTALELGTTQVSGQGMGEMTENTGSYTTGAVSVGSKTPTSLRDTPQSVSVLSSQLIEDRSVTSLQDALKMAPGVTVQKTTSDTYEFYSRGFNIDSIQIDGAAPMALSSVATSFYSRRLYNLVEFDHVEVLRGAGALFGGVGDPGGVINLVRKRPLSDFQLKFEAAAGSWDNYRSQIDLTGPLTESGNVRGRLVTAYTDRQYFTDKLATQKPTVYGVFEVDLGPQTIFTLGGMYESTHSNSSLGLPRYSTGGDIGLPRHTNLGQNWSYMDNISQEIFTKLDHYFDNDWKLNVSYTNTRDAGEALAAVSGNAVNPVTMAGPVWRASYNVYSTSQDLIDSNLSGSFDAFGREHQFVLGADYQRVTSRWQGSGAFTGTGVPINVWNPGYWKPTTISLVTPRDYSPNTQEQYGLYGRLTLQVSDPLKVILGGRAARYHFEQVYTNAGVVQSDIDMREPTRFVPYFGAIYDLDEQWSLYGSYSKIFKPQQSYLSGPVGSNQVLEPLVGKTSEVGIKGELFDGRLNTSLAVFYTKRKDGAVKDDNFPSESVLYGGSCCYLNQGEVISKGIELEASGEIRKDWNLMASYVYNYNKNETDSTALSTITPKHQFKVWTTYQLPGDLSDWTVGGGVDMQSATYVSGTTVQVNGDGKVVGENIPFDYKQSGYAVWNALLRYRVDDHWTVSLNANNLFDKVYYQTVSSAANGNFYGDPRNYMLTLRGTF